MKPSLVLPSGILKIQFMLVIMLITHVSFAQEAINEFKPKIRGAIMMANSHVPNATEGGKKVSIIPTWCFDVDYVFHPRWSVALQGDLKLQSFDVEDGCFAEQIISISLCRRTSLPRFAPLVFLFRTGV